MTTHLIDARALNVGDTFYRCADPNMPLRRVVRVRPRAVGLTEVMHGLPDHPGSLEYTIFPHGARVLVPLKSHPK